MADLDGIVTGRRFFYDFLCPYLYSILDYSIFEYILITVQKSVYTAEYAIFLEVLVESRKKSGLTQKELGIELPFEQPSISKLERGERRVDVIELRLICEKLGITLADFIQELEMRIDERNA